MQVKHLTRIFSHASRKWQRKRKGKRVVNRFVARFQASVTRRCDNATVGHYTDRGFGVARKRQNLKMVELSSRPTAVSNLSIPNTTPISNLRTPTCGTATEHGRRWLSSSKNHCSGSTRVTKPASTSAQLMLLWSAVWMRSTFSRTPSAFRSTDYKPGKKCKPFRSELLIGRPVREFRVSAHLCHPCQGVGAGNRPWGYLSNFLILGLSHYRTLFVFMISLCRGDGKYVLVTV